MLLLYRVADLQYPVSAADLHSTMLLLYHDAAGKEDHTLSTFTFHYASTLSDSAFARCFKSLNLHSTMLLLYHPQEP